MKTILYLMKVWAMSWLLITGSTRLTTTSTLALIPPVPLDLLDQPVQLLPRPKPSTLISSQVITYSYYLPIINDPPFQLATFLVTGPAYAVPAVDNRYIYVGSGFDSDCHNIGEIRAFDKQTLQLIWKTNVLGAIGDTPLTLADNQVIFGAGDGVVALATDTGRLVWQRHLKGCFQESFIRLHQGRIYIGSSTGYLYSLTPQGQVVWEKQLPDTIFAAPAVFSDTLYVADMSNNLTALKLATGQIQWQKKIPLAPGERPGIFASPLFHDNSLFIATYSKHVWRVSREGQLVARHSSSDRYVASPIVCDGSIVVANRSGQIDWLDIANLQPHYTVTTADSFVFGTPHCVHDITIMTSYNYPSIPSALYYLQQGQILKRFEFPCCKSAVPATVIDGTNVYNVLTSLTVPNEEVDLIRSKLAISP